MTERELCEACQNRTTEEVSSSRNKQQEGLDVVGHRIHGGGRSKTEYNDYVCPACGQQWEEEINRGLGGYKRHFRPAATPEKTD